MPVSDTRHSTPSWWFSDQPPPLHARALSVAYGAAIGLRMALLRAGLLRRIRIARPVLVIGNLIAGGSGKTPLAIAVVARLRAAGFSPGIATRGYGRQDPGTPLWVDASTDPTRGGDEPVLLARRAGVPVRADADRVAAGNALIAAGCDIVVCDDGLQHYRLRRDVEIEVIDGRRRHGNGRLLPAGPLREPAVRADACDLHVLNLGSDDAIAPRDGEWPMRLLATQAQPLAGGRAVLLSAFAGQRVHAVAGIGDPERFFTTLRAAGIAVVPHAFADHHAYRPEDLQFASDLPVLMTEKDAVKCAAFAGPDQWFVPVEAQLPEAFWAALLERVGQLVPKAR